LGNSFSVYGILTHCTGLDPVMGDEGRLYVADDIPPAYRSLLNDADLILPNSFEAETLAEMKITDMDTLIAAITKLHKTYQVPHIVVTSIRLSKQSDKEGDSESLSVVGSSCRSGASSALTDIYYSWAKY